MLLGDQWTKAVPVFLALGPAAIMACTNVATGWLYLSLGHVGRQLRWSMIQAPIVLLGMGVGVQFGVMGMAVAMSSVLVTLKLPGIAFACAGQPVCLTDYCKAVGYVTAWSVFGMFVGLWAASQLGGGVLVKVVVFFVVALYFGWFSRGAKKRRPVWFKLIKSVRGERR